MTSKYQSDTRLAYYRRQGLPRASRTLSTDVFPSRGDDTQRLVVASQVNVLTIHEHPHILDEDVDDL